MSQDELVASFQGVTGADIVLAKKLLTATSWNLELAVSNFFDAAPPTDPSTFNSNAAQNQPAPNNEQAPEENFDFLDEEDPEDVVQVTLGSRDKTTMASLKSIAIDATVKNSLAKVSVSLRFFNQHSTPLEAIFTIQQYDITISDFVVYIADKIVRSECTEKETALNQYDDNIASGHGSYLLNQGNEDDVFILNIGNLPPNTECIIVITYLTTLNTEDDAFKFEIPITKVRIANDPSDPIVLPSTSTTSTTTTQSIYGLSLNLKIETSSQITGIQCDSHQVTSVIRNDRFAELSLLPDQGTLQKEFSVLIGLTDAHQPLVSLEHFLPSHSTDIESTDKSDKALILTLYPKIDLQSGEEQLMEIVFLVDTSGSMAGSRITQAKNVLQLFLRSIPEGSLFNIVSFSNHYQQLFPQSREYNDQTLQTATEYVTSIKAGGGTEVLQPLSYILNQPLRNPFPRLIFLITDGEVKNTEQVIQFVRRSVKNGGTRIFTFGIGGEVSKRLVKGVARAGRGLFEYVASGVRMEGKVLAQLKKALVPVWGETRVEWGKLGPYIHHAPLILPPLFPGEFVHIYGLLPEANILNETEGAEVKLSGTITGKNVEFFIPIFSENVSNNNLVHSLTAKAIISDIEKRIETNEISLIEGKAQIIKLATKYSVVSKYTSLIAKEVRTTPTEGTLQTEDVNEKLSVEGVQSYSVINPSDHIYDSLDSIIQDSIEHGDVVELRSAHHLQHSSRFMSVGNAFSGIKESLSTFSLPSFSAPSIGLPSFNISNSVSNMKEAISSKVQNPFTKRMYSKSPAAFEDDSYKYSSKPLANFEDELEGETFEIESNGESDSDVPESVSHEHHPHSAAEHQYVHSRLKQQRVQLEQVLHKKDNDDEPHEDYKEKEEVVETESASKESKKKIDYSFVANKLDDAVAKASSLIDVGAISTKVANAGERASNFVHSLFSSEEPEKKAVNSPPAHPVFSIDDIQSMEELQEDKLETTYSRPRSPTPSLSLTLDVFILQQSAKGFWRLTPSFAQFLNLPLATLILQAKENLPDVPNAGGEADSIWATLVAIAILQDRFPAQKDEWELIQEKALRWLTKEFERLSISINLDTLLEKVRLGLKNV